MFEKDNIAKQIEMQIEEKHLNCVVDIIGKEILKNIDLRKEFGDKILEYRKKNIEEFRDDEDKIIEYFDHENYIKEEAYKRFDKRIMELNKLKTSPYFGSIEFKEDGFAPENIYVGRFGVTLEGEVEPLIVDWRAPIASLFYKGKTGRTTFQAPLKEIEVDILKRKQYIIKQGVLKGLFSSDMDIKDEILQDILSRNTSEKLRDIVNSIQQEQDEIIRLPYNQSALVDGVAGSGKTTIALHRVAYILYNYRKALQDKILIFGPNMIFMDYISNVLPELGESGVPQNTIHEFISNEMNLEGVEEYDVFLKEIFNKNTEYIEEYKYKNSEEYIKEIHGLIEKIQISLYPNEDVVFRDKTLLTVQEIEKMFTHDYKTMPLIRRSKKIRRIIMSKISSIRNEIFYEINKKYSEQIDGLTRAEKNIQENELHRKRRSEIHDLVMDSMKLKEKYLYLVGKNTTEYYEEINENNIIKHTDLAPLMYLDIKLNGSKKQNEVKHIIIDEAQDWSSIQMRVIKEYTGCENFTIVGDKNQSLMPLGDNSFGGFNEIISGLKEFELNKSYRSTKEIMEYANELAGNGNIVPLVRNGEDVEHIEITEDEKENLASKINKFLEECSKENLQTNAIICDTIDMANELNEIMKNRRDIKLIDSEEVFLSKGNIIIPVCYGKGLEFDSVIMVSTKDDGAKSRYVMATRALHKLCHIDIK